MITEPVMIAEPVRITEPVRILNRLLIRSFLVCAFCAFLWLDHSVVAELFEVCYHCAFRHRVRLR